MLENSTMWNGMQTLKRRQRSKQLHLFWCMMLKRTSKRSICFWWIGKRKFGWLFIAGKAMWKSWEENGANVNECFHSEEMDTIVNEKDETSRIGRAIFCRAKQDEVSCGREKTMNCSLVWQRHGDISPVMIPLQLDRILICLCYQTSILDVGKFYNVEWDADIEEKTKK